MKDIIKEQVLEELFGPKLNLNEGFGMPIKDNTPTVGIKDERDQVKEKNQIDKMWSDFKRKK